jgi:hypothetical protein
MGTLGMMFLVIVISAFINAIVFKKVIGKQSTQ